MESTGKLIYEGEYLNGLRNGKGKEYFNYITQNLIFEGEYLHGKKWEGKGYDIFNNNIYEIKKGRGWFKEYEYYNIVEGEYLNGLIKGNIKIYDLPTGKLIIEGEFKNGKINGKVK